MKNYFSRRKEIKLLLILLITVLICITVYTGYNYLENEKTIRYVDECERALLSSNRNYVICCQDNYGEMYLCNDKRVFEPGEYVGIQVNLQKLNKYFDPYYTCVYTNFPISMVSMPKRYQGSLYEEISNYEAFTCSKLFYQNEYHNIATAGYVVDMPGIYDIVKIWFFPNGNYSTVDDFKNNMDKSVLAFTMSGVVKPVK